MSSFQKTRRINSNKYCLKIDKLKAFNKKHLEIVNRKQRIFHWGNTDFLMIRQKLPGWGDSCFLGWEVLIHLLCSPDIAPSDVHVFQSLQSSLSGKNFNFLKDCKRHLAQKDKKCWKDGVAGKIQFKDSKVGKIIKVREVTESCLTLWPYWL